MTDWPSELSVHASETMSYRFTTIQPRTNIITMLLHWPRASTCQTLRVTFSPEAPRARPALPTMTSS